MRKKTIKHILFHYYYKWFNNTVTTGRFKMQIILQKKNLLSFLTGDTTKISFPFAPER